MITFSVVEDIPTDSQILRFYDTGKQFAIRSVTNEFIAEHKKFELIDIISGTLPENYREQVSEILYKAMYNSHDIFKYTKQLSKGGVLNAKEFMAEIEKSTFSVNWPKYVIEPETSTEWGLSKDATEYWKKYKVTKKKLTADKWAAQDFKGWQDWLVDDSGYSGAYASSKPSKLPGVQQRTYHPITGMNLSISSIIQDLNDHFKWTREKIADWLDEIDGKDGIDLSFQSKLDSRD